MAVGWCSTLVQDAYDRLEYPLLDLHFTVFYDVLSFKEYRVNNVITVSEVVGYIVSGQVHFILNMCQLCSLTVILVVDVNLNGTHTILFYILDQNNL